MRRVVPLAALAVGSFLLFQAPSLYSQGTGKVTTKVVKYDELAKEIVKHRGKVVLVDLWHVM